MSKAEPEKKPVQDNVANVLLQTHDIQKIYSQGGENLAVLNNVDVQIKSIVMKDRHFYDVDGVITWQQAHFHNSRTWVDLGNLQARLTDDDNGGLLGRVKEADQGPLITDLTIAAPKEEGLKISGDIIPQNTAHPAIREILQIVGKSDNQGRYNIDWRDD